MLLVSVLKSLSCEKQWDSLCMCTKVTHLTSIASLRLTRTNCCVQSVCEVHLQVHSQSLDNQN